MGSGPYNIGDLVSAIPAKKIKPKVNQPLVTKQAYTGVNATGAGIAYTVAGPCILVFAALSDLTVSDTTYTLTCDGGVVAQSTTGIASISLAIVNTGVSSTSDQSGASSAVNIPISCETGFTLFVKTTGDSNINVSFSYLELV